VKRAKTKRAHARSISSEVFLREEETKVTKRHIQRAKQQGIVPREISSGNRVSNGVTDKIEATKRTLFVGTAQETKSQADWTACAA
jgi:hypothetical protein